MKLIAFSSALLMATGCSTSDTGTTPPISTTTETPPTAAASQLGTTQGGDWFGVVELAPDTNLPGDDRPALTLESFPTIPPGPGVFDVSTRVAFIVHNTADWPDVVSADLDPDYAAFLASTPRTPSLGATKDPADLLLIVVSPDINDPNTMFVAFDAITDIQAIRHVTAVTFADAGAAVLRVVDVSPIT